MSEREKDITFRKSETLERRHPCLPSAGTQAPLPAILRGAKQEIELRRKRRLQAGSLRSDNAPANA